MPMDAVQPRCSNNEKPRQSSFKDSLFSCSFGLPVNGLWVDGIIFFIRLLSLSIKNIICRYMNKRNLMFLTNPCQKLRPLLINRKGLLAVIFGGIYSSIRSRIYDNIGLLLCYHSFQLLGVGNI